MSDSTRTYHKQNTKMKKKLVGLFVTVVLALVGLAIRITYINATDGEKYKRIVMTQAQQQYDSHAIAFRRGDITDRNGTLLATSEKVYNVILDCKVVNTEVEDAEGGKEQRYVEPTVRALVRVLGMNENEVRKRLTEENTKNSQYQILRKNISITEKKAFEEYLDLDSEENGSLSEEEIRERQNVRGVWFEETYDRTYPMHSLACDLVGFTYDGLSADWGIEGYYNDILNGTNGRQYGYFNTDADVGQTIIPATDGRNISSTIDVNVQQIIRKALENYNEEMATDAARMNGAQNIGVVVMDPNNGEILGMDSSRWYDLNDPHNLDPFYSQQEQDEMDDAATMEALSRIWSNFCVSDAYEPGSVFKPVTAAAALETGAVKQNTIFYCDGGEQVEDKYIQCDVYPGSHAEETLQEAMMHSCNDSLMQIASAMGESNFLKYEEMFGFGMKTGIDLPGENAGLLFTAEDMGAIELATSSFGQGFTCTMIQETAAIASLINGGYYYKPHVVRAITAQDGAVIKTVEPVLERRTVSETVSNKIREDMGTVMSMDGTGYLAKIPGYSMGGKTGTAEKLPRGQGNYVLSFVGFAPLDNPKVVVYVTVDEPNTVAQETTVYAMSIARNIFSELLPYMNIYPDESGFDSSNVYTRMVTNLDLLAYNYQMTEYGALIDGTGGLTWTSSRSGQSDAEAEATQEASDTAAQDAAAAEEMLNENTAWGDLYAEDDDAADSVTYAEDGTAYWNDPGYAFDPEGENAYLFSDGTSGTAADGTALPSLAEEEVQGAVDEVNSYFSEGMTNEEAAMIEQ